MIVTPLLDVQSLTATIGSQKNTRSLVSEVSFSAFPGQTLAVIGESGSGKTTLVHSLLQLQSKNLSVSGHVWFLGNDLLQLPASRLRHIRGKDITLVPQDTAGALNPVFTIGDQIAEIFSLHLSMSSEEAEMRAIEMLKLVNLPRAEFAFELYPHQLSGGMKQRVQIAMAICTEPRVIIFDEPTSALDLTIQKEILQLIKTLQKQFDATIIFITHDIGVVVEIADYVAVMYDACMIEYGSILEIFENPLHPYTRALLETKPELSKRKERLPVATWHPSWHKRGLRVEHSNTHWVVT